MRIRYEFTFACRDCTKTALQKFVKNLDIYSIFNDLLDECDK